MYFNYHARAKNLIKEGKLTCYKIEKNYHGISPAMVLYFSDHMPMPIRKERWEEYFDLLESLDLI